MNDLPTSAPTPNQILEQLVKAFGPSQDPTLPFTDQHLYAKRKVICLMLVEAFGKEAPISRMVSAFSKFSHALDPDDELCIALLNQIDDSHADIRESILECMTEDAREWCA